MGTLRVAYEGKEGEQRMAAYVIQPRPGDIFKLVNWEQDLLGRLPRGVRSAAKVEVTGARCEAFAARGRG